ncbi:hypothetical protein L1987_58619 [Smallanthus sonchifolius]|uniref:Uncharacterized protein n=1 Tax=Smallanthus sonchifolius TaxID=185202 RepID=A0ACB9DG91_9ASTR|nr:hypothetical protein L1987_58619 [Smallanthus sonchifolius]
MQPPPSAAVRIGFVHSDWLRIRLLPVFFLFTNKDDERLTRWKEKLLGCVESDLSGSKVLLLDRGKDNHIFEGNRYYHEAAKIEQMELDAKSRSKLLQRGSTSVRYVEALVEAFILKTEGV